MTPRIRAAVDQLNADLAEADSWVRTLGEMPEQPTWLYAVARLVERIDTSARNLEESLSLGEGAPS
ncbi:hypothetical protein O4H66_16125 [Comamonadaceae bacterium G21597-S1]|nr:hypothetical protein [Comamonadaceae bacterium G21597-S1]